MKNMRQLINLMEGVMAVPGLSREESLSEKSESEKQARFMAAAAHDPEFAKRTGMDQSVAKEFNKADTGTELLSKAMSEGEENDINFILSSIRDNYGIAANEQELMSMVAGETGYTNHPAFQQLFTTALNTFLNRDDEECGADDYTDQSMRAGEMGMEEEAFAEDIQNGYNDTHCVDGEDYFPNGADGPVVKAVGPSGARHGDNPEQKKMQVAETHKELVYAYRSFLKESAAPKKK